MAKVNWINGTIKPPKEGEYYVIQECLKDVDGDKAGDYEIFSDYFRDGEWVTLGSYSEYWRVVGWAELLMPDIPKDLQGKVIRYFGCDLKEDRDRNEHDEKRSNKGAS